MASSDDFQQLAAGRGLKKITIDALMKEEFDTVGAVGTLTPDNIDALGLSMAQTNILGAWIKELKESPDMAFLDDFQQLAAEKGLKKTTIEALMKEEFDTVGAVATLTTDNIEALRLSMAQRNMLEAWIKEVKGTEETEIEDTETRPGQKVPIIHANTITLPSSIASTLLKSIEISTAEVQEHITVHGVKDIGNFVETKLNECKQKPVNIATTGKSGAGKSSLINTLRDLTPWDDRAAKVDVKETTKFREAYLHPRFPNIVLWDLPGFNSTTFKREEYVERMELVNYDALIICSSERFTGDDLWISEEAKKHHVPFYFVRTKIDQDVRNDKDDNPSNHNEHNVIERVRLDVKAQLANSDLNTDKIFLISTKLHHNTRWDFPCLLDELIKNTPDKKQHSLILSLTALSENAIELKKVELIKRMPLVVQKLLAETDKDKKVTILKEEIRSYTEQFGLTEEDMIKHGIPPSARKELMKSVEKYSDKTWVRVAMGLAVGTGMVLSGGSVILAAGTLEAFGLASLLFVGSMGNKLDKADLKKDTDDSMKILTEALEQHVTAALNMLKVISREYSAEDNDN